jgi:hypothetical protein
MLRNPWPINAVIHKQITEYISWAPLIALLIYVTGFICLTSYLQIYNINEIPKFDLKLFKTGIVYLLLTLPIFGWTIPLMITAKRGATTSGNVIQKLYLSQFYTLIFTTSIIFLFRWTFDIFRVSLLILALFSLLMSWYEKIVFLGIDIHKYLLLVPIATVLLFKFFDPSDFNYYELTIHCLITFILITSWLMFRETNFRGPGFYTLFVCAMLYMMVNFGQKVLSGIPRTYGGEYIYVIRAKLSDEFSKQFPDMQTLSVLPDRTSIFPVVYETDETFYVWGMIEIVAIPRDKIEYFSFGWANPNVKEQMNRQKEFLELDRKKKKTR